MVPDSYKVLRFLSSLKSEEGLITLREDGGKGPDVEKFRCRVVSEGQEEVKPLFPPPSPTIQPNAGGKVVEERKKVKLVITQCFRILSDIIDN